MPKKQTAQRKSKPRKAAATSGGRKIVLEQWVEVRIRNGRTVTELTPGNDRLVEKALKMDPLPELVYRRLNFPEGVPQEYDWTGPEENVRRYGGGGLQRMTFETWIIASRREEQNGTGHIGPVGKGNLPRPKEHGECECGVCVRNADLVDDQAA